LGDQPADSTATLIALATQMAGNAMHQNRIGEQLKRLQAQISRQRIDLQKIQGRLNELKRLAAQASKDRETKTRSS
jgi:hypothetical protein